MWGEFSKILTNSKNVMTGKGSLSVDAKLHRFHISHLLTSPLQRLKSLSLSDIHISSYMWGSVYIGETGRSIEIPFQDYQRCLKTSLPTHSKSQHNNGHIILFDDTSVLVGISREFYHLSQWGIPTCKLENIRQPQLSYWTTNKWHPRISVIRCNLDSCNFTWSSSI